MAKRVFNLSDFVEYTHEIEKEKIYLSMNQKTYDRLIILYGISGYRKFNHIDVRIDNSIADEDVIINRNNGSEEIKVNFTVRMN